MMAAIVGWVAVVALIVGSICILKWCGPDPSIQSSEVDTTNRKGTVMPFPSLPPKSMPQLIDRFVSVEARMMQLEQRFIDTKASLEKCFVRYGAGAKTGERLDSLQDRIIQLEERMGRTDVARMAAAEYFRRHGKRLKSLEECKEG